MIDKMSLPDDELNSVAPTVGHDDQTILRSKLDLVEERTLLLNIGFTTVL